MSDRDHHWFLDLNEEDRNFVKRFVLASGSLKKLAQDYGISYPTVRLRLDRLIEKIKVLESYQNASRFERLLRAEYAEGRIGLESLKLLLDAYRQESEESS